MSIEDKLHQALYGDICPTCREPQDKRIAALEAVAEAARRHYDSLMYPNVRDYVLEAAFEAAGYLKGEGE